MKANNLHVVGLLHLKRVRHLSATFQPVAQSIVELFAAAPRRPDAVGSVCRPWKALRPAGFSAHCRHLRMRLRHPQKHPPTTLSSVTTRVGRDLRLARTSSSFLQNHLQNVAFMTPSDSKLAPAEANAETAIFISVHVSASPCLHFTFAAAVSLPPALHPL